MHGTNMFSTVLADRHAVHVPPWRPNHSSYILQHNAIKTMTFIYVGTPPHHHHCIWDTSSLDAPNQSTAKPCSTALRGVGRVRSACTRKTSTLTLHQAFRQNGIKVHLFHRHVHTERDMERLKCTWVREVFKGKSRPTYQHYRNQIVNTNRWFS